MSTTDRIMPNDNPVSKYRMEVDVHEPSSYWKVWNAEGTAIADGSAPDEARARACGEAVVAALEGRRILCEGSLIPGAMWPLGDAPSGTVQGQRDDARAGLDALRSDVHKRCIDLDTVCTVVGGGPTGREVERIADSLRSAAGATE